MSSARASRCQKARIVDRQGEQGKKKTNERTNQRTNERKNGGREGGKKGRVLAAAMGSRFLLCAYTTDLAPGKVERHSRPEVLPHVGHVEGLALCAAEAAARAPLFFLPCEGLDGRREGGQEGKNQVAGAWRVALQPPELGRLVGEEDAARAAAAGDPRPGAQHPLRRREDDDLAKAGGEVAFSRDA